MKGLVRFFLAPDQGFDVVDFCLYLEVAVVASLAECHVFRGIQGVIFDTSRDKGSGTRASAVERVQGASRAPHVYRRIVNELEV